jgi:YHS domain-containing protein
MKQNLKNGVAAQGYDVVSFFEGNPKKGNATITYNYDGAEFQFSSELNKVKFKNSPEAFIPQYGGFCAYAMSQGKEIIPNPKSWEIRAGKLYFFTRMFFGIIDAKRNWSKDFDDKKKLADQTWKNLQG